MKSKSKGGKDNMKRIKLVAILLVLFSVFISYAASQGEQTDFEDKLEETKYPVELDFKGTPLSDALSIISKTSNISIVAASDVADLPIDLYLPTGQNLKKIIDTIKSTNGLVSKIVNGTMILTEKIEIVDTILKGQVLGKVTEIDKITGIKGVTLSILDNMLPVLLFSIIFLA